MAHLTQADLQALNETFESRTPVELLQWAATVFGRRVALMSAMQKAGTALAHMVYAHGLAMDVLFVDTGVMFQETLDTRDRVRQEYGLNVITLSPELTMEQQTRAHGVLYLTPEGQTRCCEMRKTEPLLAVRGRYDALIGGLRRGEGERRSRVPILAVDSRLNVLRINALANFSNEALEAYVEANNVIVNPLHAQGYTTIGCNRCTTPVLPNEPARAGRWRHLGPWAMYCGINPTDVGRSEPHEFLDWPQDLIDTVLGQKTDFAI